MSLIGTLVGGGLARHPEGQAKAETENETHIASKAQIWHSDPDILGGTPVLAGTRVRVGSLFDYLEGGESLDEFLPQFPSVKRVQATAALDEARTKIFQSVQRPTSLAIRSTQSVASSAMASKLEALA